MESIHGRHKFEPEDFISRMPDNVVTNILDRLPLQDAVRTDVLSKTWRFKWTMLSQLVFDYDFFEYLSKTNTENNQVRIIIYRLLLHLGGAITKFVLSNHKADVEDKDIRHWILLLSRKRIKNLTLEIHKRAQYKLPANLFSCLELKHLTLTQCCLHPPNFHGFPNLLSLDIYLHFEEISSDSWEFISKCPLLEFLKVDCDPFSAKLKLAEIAKLQNLKILYLYLCDLDTMNNFHSAGTTFELLGSLPKLQELKLSFTGCRLTESDAKWKSSTAFSSLKALTLAHICLDDVCLPASTGRLQYNGAVAAKKCEITSDEKLKFGSKVLKLRQAFPVVDIDLS
ncbi:F-box/FBD/LRR-repeat protein At1g13570-like [Bidens hawaiensis]|uniref:F-box/FBD/LRR-repeat protein At1g13570-like n=1 Tax=Bidens hawaiensis TaxID=980011 RepID=UPI00404A26FC